MTIKDIVDASIASGVVAYAVYQHCDNPTEFGEEITEAEVSCFSFKVSCFPAKMQFIAHPQDTWGHAEKIVFVKFSTDGQVLKFLKPWA
jgi:hypothetical protein